MRIAGQGARLARASLEACPTEPASRARPRSAWPEWPARARSDQHTAQQHMQRVRDWDPAGPRRAVTPPHRIAPALPPLDWPPPGQARPLEQGDEAVHVINFDCQSHCREVKSCHERSGGRRLGRHAGTSDGNVEDATAFVDRLKVVGEYEGEDGHELHEDVER
eukprot:CAMPEP_0182539820 /NCGR_PEP_ID=MMETSP1323-20130603/26014_1 /TAXON_ID=236787 /ORGANISM="Florenciella parvula, Strain RCC1693" /LENGTH=163 /DNA_ID=CAMNT_0024750423 /DNA_START=16 /DNA_END=505 /DNA_ORIENTATION=+